MFAHTSISRVHELSSDIKSNEDLDSGLTQNSIVLFDVREIEDSVKQRL